MHGWFCCRTASLVATCECIRDRNSDYSWAECRTAALGYPSPTRPQSKFRRFSPSTSVWEKQFPFLARESLCTRSCVAFAALRWWDRDNSGRTVRTLRRVRSHITHFDMSHFSSWMDIVRMSHRQELYRQSQVAPLSYCWYDSHSQHRHRTLNSRWWS